MTHEYAKTSMATERYTLDEMESAEREDFEEHFFECSRCADDIRDAAEFAAGVRTWKGKVPVQMRPVQIPVPVPSPSRSTWLAVAASIFAVGLGYESLWVVPHLKATQAQLAPASPGEVIQLESISRGANEQVSKVVRADEAVALTFPIETTEPQPLYICEVRDDAGKVRASLPVSRAKASELVAMVLAPHTLSSGHYKLVIRGGDREIAAYPFMVEVR
ncbi:MAG TPA: hypothetical protein VN380_24155 [Thermoanaerobaculia bacterium]|jgi:hypothetical protein|nr:hypothetical protein [Thermoanaerobaculia bacterium]